MKSFSWTGRSRKRLSVQLPKYYSSFGAARQQAKQDWPRVSVKDAAGGVTQSSRSLSKHRSIFSSASVRRFHHLTAQGPVRTSASRDTHGPLWQAWHLSWPLWGRISIHPSNQSSPNLAAQEKGTSMEHATEQHANRKRGVNEKDWISIVALESKDQASKLEDKFLNVQSSDLFKFLGKSTICWNISMVCLCKHP